MTRSCSAKGGFKWECERMCCVAISYVAFDEYCSDLEADYLLIIYTTFVIIYLLTELVISRHEATEGI
jgi:hypothetical protein